jgi:hypothetical protein
MFENEHIRRVAKVVQEKILVKEIWMLLIMLATFAVQIATKNSIGVIVNLVFTIAAVIYFFSAFAYLVIPDATKFDQFYIKLVGWGSSIMCIGILFKISHYPMAGLMIKIGMMTLGVVVVIMMYLRSQKSTSLMFVNTIPHRFIVFIIIMSLTYLVENYAA